MPELTPSPDDVMALNPTLKNVTFLKDFSEKVDSQKNLSKDEQISICDRLQTLLRHVYVNLPLKRAMHGIDPVQRLRVLGRRVRETEDGLTDRKFHLEVLSIFTSLRDLHTLYKLPRPYVDKVAFLPIQIEEAFDSASTQSCRYLITHVFPGFAHTLQRGAEIVFWNSVPIARAVELVADRANGSNADARHARGLESMTLRNLRLSLPPDEHWVDIEYTWERVTYTTRLPWYVVDAQDLPEEWDASDHPGLGMDQQGESLRVTKTAFFVPEVAAKAELQKEPGSGAASESTPELRDVGAASGVELSLGSRLPGKIRAGLCPSREGHPRYGYLRIFTFKEGAEQLVTATRELLAQMPSEGLIIDVRANPGGWIVSGERLLQLFTPRPVQLADFQFVNSDHTLKLCRQYPVFNKWGSSIEAAVETGDVFSQALPFRSEDEANDIGQVYQGPVVLICDARSYSTADMFVAAFEDNEIGKVLGTSGNTGAGGANVWQYGEMKDALKLDNLPDGVTMSAAVLRATRTGCNAGVPLEELGVEIRHRHFLTERDVLGGNLDLIECAAKLLDAEQATRTWVRAELTKGGDKPEVTVTAHNLDRVDLYAGQRPMLSKKLGEKDQATLRLDEPLPQGVKARIYGYRCDVLKSSCSLQ